MSTAFCGVGAEATYLSRIGGSGFAGAGGDWVTSVPRNRRFSTAIPCLLCYPDETLTTTRWQNDPRPLASRVLLRQLA